MNCENCNGEMKVYYVPDIGYFCRHCATNIKVKKLLKQTLEETSVAKDMAPAFELGYRIGIYDGMLMEEDNSSVFLQKMFCKDVLQETGQYFEESEIYESDDLYGLEVTMHSEDRFRKKIA